MFIAVWHFIVDSWRAPKRARLLYLLFAAGFVAMAVVAGVKGDALVTGIAALAVAGAVRGDALVAAIAGVLALLVAGLAAVAPRLARLTNAAAGEPMETD